MEQTATTQLYLKLQQIEFYYQQGDLTMTEFIEAKKEALLQAEATFEQQIIETAMNCFCEGKYSAEYTEQKISSSELIKYAQQYFEQIYHEKTSNN